MKKLGLIIGIIVALGIIVLVISRLEPAQNVTTEPFIQKEVKGTEEKPVKVGESVDISNLTITLNSFLEDYRCGADPLCPEYGAVVVNVTISDGSEKVTRNFPSDEVPYEFKHHKVSITKIEPEKQGNETIPQEDYGVTFKVEPVAAQ